MWRRYDSCFNLLHDLSDMLNKGLSTWFVSQVGWQVSSKTRINKLRTVFAGRGGTCQLRVDLERSAARYKVQSTGPCKAGWGELQWLLECLD